MRNIARLALAAALALTLAAPAAWAQAWPSKPIKLINGFPPGGGADILARLVAERLSGALGQQVIVENRTGATGMIAAQSVAASPPDGYTILFSASTMAMAPALYGKSLGYDPVNGLAAIAYVASVPLILLAPMDGAKSTPELVGMLRKDPGKYSYASSGNGGMIHLASYLFATRAGGDALHVPYRGSAPGMVDMIAGRHGFQIDTLQSSKGFIDGGKVRVLGVAADKRLKQLPDVPTIKESTGFDFAINTWYAAYAPAKTPRPIIDRLNAAFNQALKQPDMMKKADELAIELVQSTPEQAKKFYDDQMAFWDPIIKQSGAKPE